MIYNLCNLALCKAGAVSDTYVLTPQYLDECHVEQNVHSKEQSTCTDQQCTVLSASSNVKIIGRTLTSTVKNSGGM